MSENTKPDPNAWKALLIGKSEKVQQAIINHHKGYNCAQAVACAFAEELGIDMERAETLFAKADQASLDRYAHLLRLKDLYAPAE